MIRFSVARASGNSKIFYKNYQKVEVDSVAELAEIARTRSISSYIYGPGVTSSGEECEGHKAGESVIEAGTVLLFDFDAKPGIGFEALCEKMNGRLGWIGGSKSWSAEVDKYHVAVVIDRELPLDKDEFVRWHRAAAQWLGFEAYHDAAMEGWTQQLAPSGREDVPSAVFEGSALEMTDVLASYRELETDSGGRGHGVDGEVDESVTFTLSGTGEQIGLKEMLERVAGGKKVRVHCLDGLLHDGRSDTALVRGGDDEAVAYYHCTGGRCGHTLVLRDPKPFEAEAEEGSAPQKSEGGLLYHLPYLVNDALMMLTGGGKVNNKDRESAFNLGMAQALELADIRLIEDQLMRFDGVMWVPLFLSTNAAFRFVQAAYKAVGFEALAGLLSAVENSLAMMHKSARVGVPTLRGNFVNMRNGMFCLDTWQLLAGDREAMFTHALPFDYDPAATCPVWEGFVEQVMLGSEDLIEAFRQAMGYLFCRDLNLEVMIGFVGEGANGKSTVIEVMRRLVGEAGAGTVSMNLLTKPSGEGQYARAGLAGKIVNFTNELSPGALMSSEFKDLISAQQLQARHPYGKPFVIPYGPKHVCSMNTTDGLIRERTHAFARRLHLIPFKFTVQERDPDLMKKLRAELPGIMNWVLTGAKTVVTTGRLVVAEQMRGLLDEVIRDANPVMQFLDECCEPHPIDIDDVTPRNKLAGMVVGVSEFFSVYKEFCEDNGYRAEGRNRVAGEVRRLGCEQHDLKIKHEARVVSVRGFFLKIRPKVDWGTPKKAVLKLKK